MPIGMLKQNKKHFCRFFRKTNLYIFNSDKSLEEMRDSRKPYLYQNYELSQRAHCYIFKFSQQFILLGFSLSDFKKECYI